MGRRRNKTGSAPPSPGGPSQPVAATPKHAGGASTDRSAPIAATPPKHAGGASTDPTTVERRRTSPSGDPTDAILSTVSKVGETLLESLESPARLLSRHWSEEDAVTAPAASSPASSKASSEPRETGRDPSPASAAQWEPAGSGDGDGDDDDAPAATPADDAPTIAELTTELLSTDPELRAAYPMHLDLSAPRFRIGSLARGLAVVRAPVLRELALDGNGLRALDGLDAYVALRVLRAAHNELAEVSVRCPKLRTLDLRHNALRSIPALGGSSALTTLRLGHNSIGGGCEQLRHAPRLHTLELDHNALGGGAVHAALARVLHSLTCLRALDVRANPLEHQLLPGGVAADAWLKSHAPRLTTLNGRALAAAADAAPAADAPAAVTVPGDSGATPPDGGSSPESRRRRPKRLPSTTPTATAAAAPKPPPRRARRRRTTRAASLACRSPRWRRAARCRRRSWRTWRQCCCVT